MEHFPIGNGQTLWRPQEMLWRLARVVAPGLPGEATLRKHKAFVGPAFGRYAPHNPGRLAAFGQALHGLVRTLRRHGQDKPARGLGVKHQQRPQIVHARNRVGMAGAMPPVGLGSGRHKPVRRVVFHPVHERQGRAVHFHGHV